MRKKQVAPPPVIPPRLYAEWYMGKFRKHAFRVLRVSFNVWFIIIAVLFLIFNIIYSQTISPLYGQIISGNRQAVINYLKNIRNSQYFQNELINNIKIYGDDIKTAINSEEIKREALIQKYERILQLNPDAKDVLIGLNRLYLEKGDKIKAENYLKRAKELDPAIQ